MHFHRDAGRMLICVRGVPAVIGPGKGQKPLPLMRVFSDPDGRRRNG